MSKNWVTIVSGLPRTGTSMMMRMIDTGGIPALTDEVRQADEDNPKGYYEFEPVKRTKKDASWLNDAPGKVVKMVHLLLLDLPTDREYRVVFTRRNLEEVVKSQDVMLERKGKAADDMDKADLIRVFETQLRKVDRYLEANECFQVLYVNYNRILKNPSPTVEVINAFLGGDLDVAAMHGVVDPKLYRQRKS